MKQIQFRLVDKSTNEVLGYVVGKTINKELIIQQGNANVLLKITKHNEAKYFVEKVEASNE